MDNSARRSSSLEDDQKHGYSDMVGGNNRKHDHDVNVNAHRFPHSIVWTPIPCITWFLPFIGHLGIAYTNGVIRDFAGPYHVSEDDMGFGWPTRYLQLDLNQVLGGAQVWDTAVYDASELYKTRMHNLFCDNCHSHVARALNQMKYKGSTSWNMIWLCALITFRAKHTSFVTSDPVLFFFCLSIQFIVVLVWCKRGCRSPFWPRYSSFSS